MAVVLSNQIDASVKSADELESGRTAEHRSAMFCFDVEDLAAEIVRLYHELGRQVEKWQDHLAKNEIPSEREQLLRLDETWLSLYTKLEATATKVVHLIKYTEGLGYRLDGKVAFKECLKGLREITCLSLDRVRGGFASIASGDGLELDQFFDSL
jgi:hypothetical protein